MNHTRITSYLLRALAPFGLALFLLFGLGGTASAQKVGNPGNFNFKVDSGLMKVKSQEFPFDATQNINFNGTVDKNGNINIPTMTFPVFEISASGFNLKIYINVIGPTTGTINPVTGAASLRLKVWIKIDGVPLGGGCRIASAGSPVDVNTLVTGLSGTGGNALTGSPYDLSTGNLTLVNTTFGVPGSSDCGIAAGTVDSTVGLPSPAGNNQAVFNITTAPKLTRAISPVLNASPATGTAPFTTTLSAAGTTVAAGPATYRWDFTNDGTIDQTTSTQSVSHTYTSGGTQTARVVVVDADGDTGEATRQLTVNAFPDLKLSAAHTGNFRVGNIETYRVNLENIGYAATSGPVNVTSTLPAGLTYDSVTGSGWGCSASGQDLTCSRSTAIPVGGNAPELGVKVKVAASARPSVNPTFTVAATGDNGPTNNSAADPTQVTATDLKLNLSHSGHSILIGADPANLITLSAENIGDAATVGATVIEDELPAGLTPVSADGGSDWSCVIAGQKVTCTHAAAINPGVTTSSITLAVSGSLDQDVLGTTVNNVATVTAADDVDQANNTVTDPTLILNGQDVGITKSHAGEFTAGQDEQYSLAVKNFGVAPTTGPTTVTDALPTGLTFVAADGGPDWACGEVAGTVTCSHDGPLAAGAEAPPIELTVEVGVDAIPAVTNTATVATPDDPNPANDSSSDEAIVQAIDLAITKTHEGVIRVGQETTYKLAVKNIGDSPSNGVSTVTDVLPTGLTFVAANGGPDWVCDETAGTVTCDHAGLLEPNESAADIELKVMVGAAAAPEVTNTASVATDDDFNPDNNSGSDTADVIEADTSVSIGRTGTFRPGQTGTYQVTVRNQGSVPTAADTDVSVVLGNGLTYSSVSANGWTCGESAGTVTCSLTAPLAGETTAPAIRVKVAVGTDAAPETTTTVTATTAGDRNPANDDATDTASVLVPDLAVTASHDGDFRVGGIGIWRVDVRNNGTGATTGPITVTDTVPAGTGIADATGNGWSCQISGQEVTCERDQALAADAEAGTISIEVRPTSSALDPGETTGTVTNNATVSTANDSEATNDQAGDDTILNAVDVALAIDGPEEVAVGETAEWRLNVENTGHAATDGGIRVTDILPAGFTSRNSGGDGWVCASASAEVTCETDAETTPGEMLPVLTVRARAGSAAVGPVINRAVVATAGDVITANDEATLDSVVTAAPDLTVELESRAPAFRVGETGSYELRVKNAGSAPASGPIGLTVELPGGVTFAGLDHGQGWDCDDSFAGELTCQRTSTIESGELSALGFRLSFGKSAAATVEITARVEGPADLNPANDEATVTSPVNRIDLALTRTAQGTWTRTETGQYTLKVENLGTAATDGPVTITETLPYGATLNTATGDGWSCQVDKRILSCINPEPIAPGGSSELGITLDIARPATSPIAASSTVETDGDVNPENDTATERINLADAVKPVPGKVTFRAGKAPITSGGVITIWLSCPAQAAGKCRGTLSLKTASRIKVRKVKRKYRKARLKLGSAPYSLAAGQTMPVQIQIGKKALKALKLNRKVKGLATATGEGVSKSSARITIGRTR